MSEAIMPPDSPTTTQQSTNSAPSPETNGKRNKMLILFTLLIAIIGLGWFLLWFFYLSYWEYTDDAYSNGNMISVNTVVSGSVVAFYADNTDLVHQGQLLASLDPTEYQINFDRSIAALASTVLQVRQYYDNVKVARAQLNSSKVQLQKTSYDFQNREKLVNSKAVSNEDFIHARDNFLLAEFAVKQARAALKVALDAAGPTPIRSHPKILESSAAVRKAYYELKHCSVYAPVTGYVAQRALNVGESVAPNTPLLAIIPTDYVWVDANYKETQLTAMRVGQPTTVTFDMYGSDVVYKGKVIGIGMGSGSVFSIIPPQNATGNWIKIVQRLPVRISLDPEMVSKYPVRIGISASVYVDITDTSLPMLTKKAEEKVVSSTSIFDIDMKSVDELIKTTIDQNLATGE